MSSVLVRTTTVPHFCLHRRILLLLAALISFILPWSGMAHGAEVTLQWDASGGASGYVLHYGNQSRTYDELIDLGPKIQHTVSGLAEGKSYYFAVTAYSDNDESEFSEEVVHATVANKAPTANAGPDKTVEELRTVSLDGSNSLDPDDGIQTLSWKQVSGPAVQLSNPQEEIITFNAPQIDSREAVLVFELVVRDYGDLVSTDSCAVTVKPRPAEAPPPDVSGGDEPPPDTVNIFKAVYRTRKDRLALSARTDANSAGVVLTAWAETGGNKTKLGTLRYNSRRGYYSSVFRNLDRAPERIIVSSSTGGEASRSCSIR